MRQLLKTVFVRAHTALGVGAARARKVACAGLVPVLNFHRISDDETSAYRGVPPAAFDAFLAWLKKAFDVVTLDGLAQPHSPSRARAVLSFDDGYKDFVETAAPILEKHGLKANQNIVPQCVDDGAPPLNVLLQDFLGQAPHALLREVVIPGFDARAFEADRSRAALRMSAFLKHRPIAEQRALFAPVQQAIARMDDFRPTPMMRAADLRQLAADHELGAHSFEHATMTAESDAYFEGDLVRCTAWFEEHLGFKPGVYAFPNGVCREGQPARAQAAGYHHVLLVGEAFARASMPVIPRFTMYGESAQDLRFRALGSLSPIAIDAS